MRGYVQSVLGAGDGVSLDIWVVEDFVVVATLPRCKKKEEVEEENENDEDEVIKKKIRFWINVPATPRRAMVVLTGKVLSPKKKIESKCPCSLRRLRQYVLSQPMGNTSKLICKGARHSKEGG